jgi:hypothetical protein
MPENPVTIFVSPGFVFKMLLSSRTFPYAPYDSQLRMKSDYFPTQNLEDWFLQPRRSMFTARNELNLSIS